MAKYMLVLRDSGGYPAGISPDEIQRIIEKYRAWSSKVAQMGRLAGGDKLRDGEGRVIRRSGSKTVVTDGPFSETKEVMGGFFLVEAESYDEVVEMAGDCPHLDFGSIEVREIEPV